ncbi:hypothetical protein FRC16_005218 [Serendipita sp. 398]|nr:hypothetical protein FRC16_005218 [Serendipita sp. 398]
MSDKIRAELEAKRAKLEALRRAKKSRSATATPPVSGETDAIREREKAHIHNIVSNLLGERGSRHADSTPGSSVPSTPAPGRIGLGHNALELVNNGTRSISRQSDSGSERGAQRNHTLVQVGGDGPDSVMSSAFVPDLIEVEQELFEMPQKERVVYDKEVQTAALDDDSGPSIEDLRRQLRQEYEQAQQQQQQRQQELEAEAAKLDKEIEEEIRELTEEERASILVAPEFLNFVEQSSKIVQRALNDNYDYTRDYTVGAQTGEDDLEGKRVKKFCAFWDERWCKNRSITDADWSPRVGTPQYMNILIQFLLLFSIPNSASLHITRILLLSMSPTALLLFGTFICWNVPNLYFIHSPMSYLYYSPLSILISFLEELTLDKFYSGIPVPNIYLFSKLPYPLQGTRIPSMPCKWWVRRTPTTSLPAVRTEWCTAGWSTCWPNRKNHSSLSIQGTIRQMKLPSPRLISRTMKPRHFGSERRKGMYIKRIVMTELVRKPGSINMMCTKDIMDL